MTADETSLDARGNEQTADQVAQGRQTSGFEGRPDEKYYDPSAWAPVGAQRFGTSGRNSVRAPGFWNLNLSLFRTFDIGQTARLQFRAEAFHLTNHPQWGNPNLDVSSPNFMEITSASGNRSIRLSTRLTF
ncbi:MAG: hypothetical protein GEV06_21705 [Luteitalea sp.]|nr:hypothetical protein [Luteitalea sp.]